MAMVDPLLITSEDLLSFVTLVAEHWTGQAPGLASFVCEADLSPQDREEVAAAAGVDVDLLQQVIKAVQRQGEDAADSAAQPELVSPGQGASHLAAARPLPFGVRLSKARPAEGVGSHIDWTRLSAVESTEALSEPDAPKGSSGKGKALCVEINSGGQVFFALLGASGSGTDQEEEHAVVIKFCSPRHMLQSEQMAAELARHLEVGAPESRLLFKAHDSQEWSALEAAAGPLCPGLVEAMKADECLLLLQFIPGENMQKEVDAWKPESLPASSRAFGRLLVLDMLLGNPDRLPVKSLSWRGNPANILWSRSCEKGGGESSHCVPIDAVVARRPPKLLVQDADQKVARVLELVMLDRQTAYDVLLEAVSSNEAAVAAVKADWAACGNGASVLPPNSSVKAFNEGVRSALALAVREQGLLEMIVQVIRSWLDSFLADVRSSNAKWSKWKSRTRQLQHLESQADKSDDENRMSSWQALLKEKSRALRKAVDDWGTRRGVQTALSLRGFLGDSVLNPFVDAYELLVRLEQVLARVKVMADAGNVTRPADLAPAPLLVGGATSAGCFHYLRKAGVTCILNCSADLPAPPPAALGRDIKWHRLVLEDTEDQDLSQAFEAALQIIDEVAKAGGRVLVHCHEGKSRSCSICLAYMVSRERRPLAEALAFLKSQRREAKPNLGFWTQLLALELATLGSNSAAAGDMPKGKPKALTCEICGEAVGLTAGSLDAHMKLKHRDQGGG